jgi:hypothetical protein
MDYITGVAFSPNGRQLAVSSRGVFSAPAVTVWELISERGLHRLHGLLGQIETIVVSPDGRRLAALAQNWEVGLWDLDTGHLRAIFEAPPGSFADNAGLAFSPDGRHLAYAVGADRAGAACLWNTETCLESNRWKLPPGLQNKLIFDPAEDRLWHFQVEIENGLALPDSALDWRQHPRIGRLRNLKAKDPTQIVAEVTDFNRHIYLALGASDGQHLVIEGKGGPEGDRRWIKIVELATGKAIWSHEVLRDTKAPQLILEPSGKAFVFTSAESTPALRFSLPAGEPCGILDFMPRASTDGGEYHCLVNQGTIRPGCFVVRNKNARPVAKLLLDTELVAVTFDRGGRRLVCGGTEGSVVVCDFPEIRKRLNHINLGW